MNVDPPVNAIVDGLFNTMELPFVVVLPLPAISNQIKPRFEAMIYLAAYKKTYL